MHETIEKQVAYLEFINRENCFHHHKYDEDMLQFEYIKNGDLRSVEETRKLISSGKVGHLSDDPVKNRRYLNICHVTLCTRFAIEGGMDAEKAYNASDLYIQRFDKANTVEELYHLDLETTEYFTKQVIAAQKAHVYSKPIVQCMDYIQYHLHEAIVLNDLAKMVQLNPSYLSVLFQHEVGMRFTEYVQYKRMETASNMLKFSDLPLSEISDILHFSSYSHFASVFRKHYGMSPKQYRNRYCRSTTITE